MSMEFDGVDDGLRMGLSIPSLQNVTGSSIMSWIKVTGMPNPAIDDKATVIGTSIGPAPGLSDSTRTKIKIHDPAPAGSDTHFRCDTQALDGDSNSVVRADGGSAGLELCHIAATVDYTTREVKIYKNGVLIKQGIATNMTAGNTSNTLGKVGSVAVSPGGITQFFDGFEEDARLYSRVLSAAEIATIFACEGVDGIVFGLQQRYELQSGPAGALASSVSPQDVAQQQISASVSSGVPLYQESITPTFRRRLP
jgi:hypothetical protein